MKEYSNVFISKINGISNKIGFKGYQHVKNDVGESIMKFNYPYDSDKETCEVHIYRAVPDNKYNYKLSDEPIAKIQLKPEGVNVNLQDITNLDKDAPFAYKIVRKDGIIISNTLLSRDKYSALDRIIRKGTKEDTKIETQKENENNEIENKQTENTAIENKTNEILDNNAKR